MSKQRPPLTKEQKVGFGVAVGLLPILAIIITIGAINERNAPTSPAATTTAAPAAQEPGEAASSPTRASAEPKAEAVLTVENNKDLAALLAAVEDYDLFQEFAVKYEGRTIKFDGIIAAMNHHGDYKTRYDILVLAGDSVGSGATGPNFQFRDVNITSDLRLTGSNIPETIGVGQKLRITAEVEGYAGNQDLFLLDPASTEVR
ncbi:DUF4839 domain-containing protein [Micromonospora soli]|uniref:DUF4839 domain-containing protein n=1 Tax=Micromonospora sp. NBRC 110009 TaxID=3061627 RepID=UPI002672CDA3|nr:DUF4839 domain-containing protein [Micromonospora sp. NBRC 110009]WKT98664.1 DUF4839 domain-containing protein [Micromonospora sp. NBRC 110009]